MKVINRTPDPEVARIADRLLNPLPEDIAHAQRVEKIRTLIDNFRDALPPLSEHHRQLIGLYILNAVYLGEGGAYDVAPTLDPPKPPLRVVRPEGDAS